MQFNQHSNLNGTHAFLSGSKHSWINYDQEKLSAAYLKFLAVQKGIELHAFAKDSIDLGIKLPKAKKALNQFVNDAIGYRMKTEVTLFYSFNIYGTADAISFRDNVLRIHDLKTGVSPVSMAQLCIYAALFCLEYDFSPKTIKVELRIYQGGDVIVHNPDTEEISRIMDKIILFDKELDRLKLEE